MQQFSIALKDFELTKIHASRLSFRRELREDLVSLAHLLTICKHRLCCTMIWA